MDAAEIDAIVRRQLAKRGQRAAESAPPKLEPIRLPVKPQAEPSEDEPYTRMPNAFITWIAPTLNEGELRVMLYLMRRTLGHHRDHDAISLGQFCRGQGEQDRGTGLSRQGVVDALASLEHAGYIERRRVETGKWGRGINVYRLHLPAKGGHT